MVQALIVAAVAMHAWGAMAAQSLSRVTVSVAAVDELRVSDASQGITLSGIPGSNDLEGLPDSTARITYIHNAPVARKITAEVKPEGMPSGRHDINLYVRVAGGDEKAVVRTGEPAGPCDVMRGLSKGAYLDTQVTYRATATARETPPGSYGFTVTFTSLDDQ